MFILSALVEKFFFTKEINIEICLTMSAQCLTIGAQCLTIGAHCLAIGAQSLTIGAQSPAIVAQCISTGAPVRLVVCSEV